MANNSIQTNMWPWGIGSSISTTFLCLCSEGSGMAPLSNLQHICPGSNPVKGSFPHSPVGNWSYVTGAPCRAILLMLKKKILESQKWALGNFEIGFHYFSFMVVQKFCNGGYVVLKQIQSKKELEEVGLFIIMAS